MNLTNLHIPYIVPAVLLAVAIVIRLPTFARAWRDQDLRATTLLLLLALSVFVSVAPSSIHKINVVTGVPNFAAPWTYTLLTTFCASCLALIIRWREEPSPRRKQRVRLVWLIYVGIAAALWGTFLLADVPTERIYDLDTYYANTPFMREHIVLYLLTYMISSLVTAFLIWTWIGDTGAWLRAGLACLQIGYGLGLIFDVAKLVAVGARWAGKDWDWLSVKIAPPFAILGASLVAMGFILPQAGPFLEQWSRKRLRYWRLRPLWQLLSSVEPSAAHVRLGLRAPFDVRMLRRESDIHDGLLKLNPYLNPRHHQQAYDAAVAAGRTPAEARGLAGAASVLDAVAAYRKTLEADAAYSEAPADNSLEESPLNLNDIASISSNLRASAAPERHRDGAVFTESHHP
ncbi:MAB_1171c family putative transporter [Streptomyces sp. NPDC058256]|uniref:MAB_1171c family putative transporter n=1 Tax=Streptomyces sp. NPDC058256 TaxID=3346408 RepID=UPI0036E0A7E0